MKKKLPAVLLCLCLMVSLAACDQPSSEGTGSLPPEDSPEASAPAKVNAFALREGETTDELSDILDGEQLALFEQAAEFYGLTFGGDTSAIDTYREPIESLPEPEEPVIERDGMIYQAAVGYWADWDGFDRIMHTLFTDRFWTEKNEASGFPIYIGYNGRMYYLSAAMGEGGHNDNFPDLYRLDGRTADSISFTIIGHYSEMRPLEGESYEKRDQRVATTYDYTLEFPIRLVLTEDGWRFDLFHSSRSASDISAAKMEAGII